MVGSRRLKNQYIHELKGEIERLQHALKTRDQELNDREEAIRMQQAYAAFLEKTLVGHHISMQSVLREFITEYFSLEPLDDAQDMLPDVRDNPVRMNA